MKILFLGDVMGRAGRSAVAERLPALRAEWKLDFVVVNGENASGGMGLTPEHARVLLQAGADVLTLGDHAFDRQGGRLGYGGGFYDRTLAMLRAAGPTLAIGFAWAAQEDEALPLELTDQPLDLIVTESEVIRP